MRTADLYTQGGAIFSPCRTWRYTLWRKWGNVEQDGAMNVIGLNPSTADETKEDNTVRRCIRWAHAWGYSGLYMTNLFAFRSTKPKGMYEAPNPTGPENVRHLIETAKSCGLVIAAWGTHGAYLDAGRTVARILQEAGVQLHCLGLTKDGFPRHPLYLKNDVQPVRFLGP